MMNLSEHFTLEEMTHSQLALRRGIDNTPDDDVVAELERLCNELLEPARLLLGVPLHIDSGYRSPALNTAVYGAVNSAHPKGQAADAIPVGMNLREAFDRLRLSNLEYDQLIIECGAWLHLSIAPIGAIARRQMLVASGIPGHWTYNFA